MHEVIKINVDDQLDQIKQEWKAIGIVQDQKAKADAGKPRLTLVPRQMIWDVAAVREYGVNKYPDGGPDNWKQVAIERYRDAMYRHFMAYLDDPYGVDAESGLPHLWHCMTNGAFLCELEHEKIEKEIKRIEG